LPEVLDQVRLCGATAVDLWPKVHGNQREQLTEMGVDAFRTHLQQREIGLGCLTQFPLGPFGLAEELRLAQSLDCRLIVTSCPGTKGQQGEALRRAVREFLQRMEPHLALAAETGVVIAIENHSHSLIDSVEALLALHELNSSPNLGIAFAPYHLPQDVGILSECLRELGSAVKLFYAWQHGKGCMQAQPKADELLQMPGRGDLDFRPLMTVLRDNHYEGWIEIFMHPFPRGIPILETVAEVTAEINRARDYLDHCFS
jgi:sugar phosphate isomerase/epimerase